jgi:uncharacterized protein
MAQRRLCQANGRLGFGTALRVTKYGRACPSGRYDDRMKKTDSKAADVDFLTERCVQAERRISVDSAAVITKWSRRTWWRRIADGDATRLADDSKGRAMLSFAEVQAQIYVPMNPEDVACLVRADAGDAEAQNDIGQLFLNAGQPEAGVYWLQLATKQDHADAMQCLGRCYVSGDGVPKDANIGIMWIAKAAAYGHAIAQAQMNKLQHR